MRVRQSQVLTGALAALVLAATLVLSTAPPASAAPGAEDWLGWVNSARSQAGQRGITARGDWSTGARNHAKYAVRNQRFAHSEDPRLPYHTSSGEHATRTGNLFGSTVRMTPQQAIDGWLESPGHALWILHPHATAAGYGEFHDPNQPAGGYQFPLRWVSVLPIVDSVSWNKPPVAFTYPAAGVTLARRPKTLYATYTSGVRCPCSATVTVGGKAVSATASVASPGGSYPHGNTVVVRLASALPTDASVTVTVKPSNAEARTWSFGPAREVHTQFRDVPRSAYYYQPVDWAWRNEVASGTTTSSFTPAGAVTRAQAVTFLWRAAGEPRPSGAAGFGDVPGDAYYAEAAAWAEEEGIAAGTTSTTFSPAQPVSRAQMVTFLWRAARQPEPSSPAAFADVPGDAYYAGAVAWAEEASVTGGTTPSTFSPTNTVTRAQAITFLWRAR